MTSPVDVVHVSGSLTGNTTWSDSHLYVVDSAVTVPDGITLTVEAGTIVKAVLSSSNGLNVSGILLAQGTAADPVIFTSYRDDSYGGDTNGDGISSTPSPGNWAGLNFLANSDGSVLDHVKIAYASTGVNAQNASFTLTNSEVAFCSSYGVNSSIDETKSTPAGITIQGNSIRDGGGTGIYASVFNNDVNYVTPQSPVIIGNTVSDNDVQGIVVRARSVTSAKATLCQPTIENNVISGSGYYADQWAIEVGADLLSPALSTNTGSGNKCQAMALAGTIAGNWTWTAGADLLPMLINDTYRSPYLYGVTVPAGRTLTVQAGAVVKGRYTSYASYLNVSGILLAQGTAADPVIFTSYRDDSYGGDTNGDGISSTPSPGNWAGLNFLANSDGSVLDHVKIAYASTGVNAQNASFTLTNSEVAFCSSYGVNSSIDETKSTPAGITIQGNSIRDGGGTGIYASVFNNDVNYVTPQSPVIIGNTVSDNDVQGIVVRARSVTSAKATLCQPTIENNVISGSGYYADQWAIEVGADLLSPALSTNTGSGNKCQAMALAGTIAGNWTWTAGADLLPMLINDTYRSPYLYGVTVPAGRTLTVQAGAVVKGRYTSYASYLNVSGILLAQGTAADPVIFTSYRDDSYGGDTNGDGISSTPSPGNWAGLNFLANSDGSVLDHVKIAYASTGVNAQNASFTLTNSEVAFCSSYGVNSSIDETKSTPAGITIQGNSIRDGGGTGIYASVFNNDVNYVTPQSPVIIGNTVSDNDVQGIVVRARSVTSAKATLCQPTIENNVISGSGYYADQWAIEVGADLLPRPLHQYRQR